MVRSDGYFPFGDPDHRSTFTRHDLGSPCFIDGGVSAQRQPLVLTEHVHRGYEVHLIQRGAMPQELSDGQRLVARGGEVVLVQPGVLHRGEHNIIPKCSLLWLVFDPCRAGTSRCAPMSARELRLLDDRLRACGNQVARANDRLLAAGEQCWRALARCDAYSDRVMDPLLLRTALWDLILGAITSLEAGRGRTHSPVVASAMRHMADALDRPLEIDDLVRRSGLSASRFYERFKGETGSTPADHHVRMRIAAACENLRREPQIGIAEIAGRFGFTNARHFATVFKRFTGSTPSAWRAKLGG